MSGNAYKLRWNCQKDGCFNDECRLKFEVFSDCFPGRINFSDVDGIVEMNGKALMVEWKFDCLSIPRGQQIMFENMTRGGDISVICVSGDASKMEVRAICAYTKGKFWPWHPANMDRLKIQIRRWVLNAQRKDRRAGEVPRAS